MRECGAGRVGLGPGPESRSVRRRCLVLAAECSLARWLGWAGLAGWLDDPGACIPYMHYMGRLWLCSASWVPGVWRTDDWAAERAKGLHGLQQCRERRESTCASDLAQPQSAHLTSSSPCFRSRPASPAASLGTRALLRLVSSSARPPVSLLSVPFCSAPALCSSAQ